MQQITSPGLGLDHAEISPLGEGRVDLEVLLDQILLGFPASLPGSFMARQG
jgi:hypothetical protein